MARFTELKTVDSTNSWLALHAASLKAPVFVRADEQTAGRGRLARSWFSGAPQQNLMMSVLWRFDTEAPVTVPVLAALALLAALPRKQSLRIKWPNDIYFEGSKLAGVLCERIQGEPRSIIIGIGVNVNVLEFPAEIVATATSLAQVCTEEHDIRALWIRICRSLAHRLRRATALLSPQTINEFNAHAWRYIVRPEISETPLEFQTLLADGRAQCKDGIILDMAG